MVHLTPSHTSRQWDWTHYSPCTFDASVFHRYIRNSIYSCLDQVCSPCQYLGIYQVLGLGLVLLRLRLAVSVTMAMTRYHNFLRLVHSTASHRFACPDCRLTIFHLGIPGKILYMPFHLNICKICDNRAHKEVELHIRHLALDILDYRYRFHRMIEYSPLLLRRKGTTHISLKFTEKRKGTLFNWNLYYTKINEACDPVALHLVYHLISEI